MSIKVIICSSCISLLILCSTQMQAQVNVPKQVGGNANLFTKRVLQKSISDKPQSDWPLLSGILDQSSSTYTETWDDVNCRTLHGGAYLGNGDFGVHLGGNKHSLVYYLGKNGFHAGNDVAAGQWTQHILNLAMLTIEKSTGTDTEGPFKVTQDIKNAEIRAQCTMAGMDVQTKCFISDRINAFVLELSTTSGKNVPVRAKLSVIGNEYVTKKAGYENKIAWVSKDTYEKDAPFYVKGAVAMKLLGTPDEVSTDEKSFASLQFIIPADGSIVRIVLNAEHFKNAGSPLPQVQSVVQKIKGKDIHRLYEHHLDWWKNFWLKSYIHLGDDIQKYWYNHLFLMGSAARSGADNKPGKAPGHWGPWNRSDDMMWFSNISMNYNGQNPYYGTFAANHVDIIDPYIETVKYYSENTGRTRVKNRWVSPTIASKMPDPCRGVAYELSFTSHGTSCGEGSWVAQDGSMPTNAVFGILPVVWKWKYGQDSSFLANTCYPLMREVVDFFDDYIGKQDEHGQYNVYGSVHEGDNWFTKNDMFSLGSIKFLYREMIVTSIKLGVDAERREHWQDILDHMSVYPLQQWGNSVTYRPDWVHDVMDGLTHAGGARNTGLMFTTTFDNIGFNSLPAYKIATCNTLDKGNMFYPQRFSGWQDSNDFGMMFVMAIRSGYRPDLVIKAIKGWKPELNGIVSQKSGGGIETAGIIEAINNMLLQSHDGVIRIFPNWDRTKDAAFNRLRTVGAFLVNATYRASGQFIDSVEIFSEKGNTCTVQSPWRGKCLIVSRNDNQESVNTIQDEDEFLFATIPGVTYTVKPVDCSVAIEGSPVIINHPVDITIDFSNTATFTVNALGKELNYQWQKNRVDIPGATSSSYTTEAITLLDVGSEYRCVINNALGTVKSNPGILNPNYKTMTPK
jgi:alpha-L-fucosidase 2